MSAYRYQEEAFEVVCSEHEILKRDAILHCITNELIAVEVVSIGKFWLVITASIIENTPIEEKLLTD